jgi:two-component system CheB/CheR fusion protein
VVEHHIQVRQQHLELTLPATPCLVDADPTRLEQVFGNLLVNASKFTERGGHIWVRVEAAEPEVVICVRDDGAGIEADKLPHVFDLFMQADRSLARTQGGLGIGLTLVSRLVHLHGGSVSVTSAGAGQGSEFQVRLPLLKGGKVAAVEPTNRRASVKRRVLVVDDNVDAAQTLATLMRLWGHEAQTAYAGPAALEAAAAKPPEVVVLDIGLPGLDGYEVAEKLRQLPGMRKALLVALTGYGHDEDRRRALQAGFDVHLTKPADPEALQELLGRASEQ